MKYGNRGTIINMIKKNTTTTHNNNQNKRTTTTHSTNTLPTPQTQKYRKLI